MKRTRYVLPTALMLLLLSAPLAFGQGTLLRGTYSGKQIFSRGGSPYIIDGRVDFDASSEAKILPKTEFVFLPDAFLSFQGRVTVLSNPANPVVFRSDVPTINPWENPGLAFYGIDGLSLEAVVFRNINMIHVLGCSDIVISGSQFINLETGLVLEECSGLVDDNSFSLTDDFSLVSMNNKCIDVWRETGTLTISNNSFKNFLSKRGQELINDYVGWAIRGANNFDLKVLNNTFENGFSGIYVWGIYSKGPGAGGIEIRDNSIHNARNGIEVGCLESAELGPDIRIDVAGNDISTGRDFYLVDRGPVFGIILHRSLAKVRENRFRYERPLEGATHAICLGPGSQTEIVRNIFEETTIACDLNLEMPNPNSDYQTKYVIKENTVYSCETIAYIYCYEGMGALPSPGDRIVTHNNFLTFNSAAWCVLTEGVFFEDFSNNYWGGLTVQEVLDSIHHSPGAINVFPVALVPFIF